MSRTSSISPTAKMAAAGQHHPERLGRAGEDRVQRGHRARHDHGDAESPRTSPPRRRRGWPGCASCGRRAGPRSPTCSDSQPGRQGRPWSTAAATRTTAYQPTVRHRRPGLTASGPAASAAARGAHPEPPPPARTPGTAGTLGTARHLAADRSIADSSSARRSVRPISAAIRAISPGPIPAVVSAAEPRRRPEVMNGERGSSGMVLRLQVIPARSSDLLGHLAGQLGVEGPQVDQHHVVVGAPRTPAGTPRRPAPRPSALALATTRRGVRGELRPRRFGERHRLGRDDVLERAALQAREDRRVDLLGQVLPAQDGAAARTAQRLVGGEGDHVGHPDRARVHPAGDQAGRVGGVEHEAARRPRRRSRGTGTGSMIRAYAVEPATISLGCSPLGQVGHLVEVDDLAGRRRRRPCRRHPVGDEAPDLAR